MRFADLTRSLVFAVVCGAIGFLPAWGRMSAADPQPPAVPAPKPAGAHTDQDRIQGEWRLTLLDVTGTVIRPEDDLGKIVFQANLFFKGDRCGQVGYNTSQFMLDETHSPKHINITTEDDKRTYLGIYSLDGDTLKLCISDVNLPRPEEFVGKKGQSMAIAVRDKSP